MTIVAQASGPAGAAATGGTEAPGWAQLLTSPIPLMVLLLGVMYFFVFRSKRTQDRQRHDMLAEMKRGDRVQTIGGILGKVVEAEATRVLVKVDENSNTKIWFARSAIHRVLGEEKADAK
jgi:preprotein translocase subunit YajC